MLDVEALSEMMAGIISEEVEKAVAPLQARIAELEAREPLQGPPGEKGEAGERGEKGEPGQDGRDGANGKDAAGIVEVLKDSGELVLTLADGRLLRTGIRDGERGADGRDGLGFEDLDACVLADDRTIELSFRRGDEEKAFTFKWPTIIYRGIFRDGEQYERGDAVTFGGNLWHCDEPTTEKPAEKKAGVGPWTIAAKRGRDGKDARA